MVWYNKHTKLIESRFITNNYIYSTSINKERNNHYKKSKQNNQKSTNTNKN